MKAATFAIVLFSLASLAQSPTSIPTRLRPFDQPLMANSRAVFAAEKSKDVTTLKNMLTDDFQQVGSEGKLHSKTDFLDDAKDGSLKDYMLYNMAALPVDENAAIVTYDAVIHLPEGDDGLAPRYQHFSDVWVKQGADWRLRFQQSTAVRHID